MEILNSSSLYQKDEEDPLGCENYSKIAVGSVINNIKNILENQDDLSQISKYIKKVENEMKNVKIEPDNVYDREYIKTLIQKHPFFKNPNNYHIRLITIMKYLKKKGVDTAVEDLDLIVDEIIQEIPGVVKKGYGRYSRKKNR
jgi:hydroxymethylpyrimidine pyrophosphatase-like HAD family hydrolase